MHQWTWPSLYIIIASHQIDSELSIKKTNACFLSITPSGTNYRAILTVWFKNFVYEIPSRTRWNFIWYFNFPGPSPIYLHVTYTWPPLCLRMALQLTGLGHYLAWWWRKSSWWRHHMETFPCYWSFVWGIHRLPVNSPTESMTQNFDVFVDLHLNKRLSKQSWRQWFETPSLSLWRQCNVEKSFVGSQWFHKYRTMYVLQGRTVYALTKGYFSISGPVV